MLTNNPRPASRRLRAREGVKITQTGPEAVRLLKPSLSGPETITIGGKTYGVPAGSTTVRRARKTATGARVDLVYVRVPSGAIALFDARSQIVIPRALMAQARRLFGAS